MNDLAKPITRPRANWGEASVLQRVAAEIVAQAVREAMGKVVVSASPQSIQSVREVIQNEAREWLVSSDAEPWIECAGYGNYNPQSLRAWVQGGCKAPVTEREKGPRGGTSDSRNHRAGKYSRGEKPQKARAKKVCF
jgi:hypothetical protein